MVVKKFDELVVLGFKLRKLEKCIITINNQMVDNTLTDKLETAGISPKEWDDFNSSIGEARAAIRGVIKYIAHILKEDGKV